jgi:Hemerythrin HHE cation binding domain
MTSQAYAPAVEADPRREARALRPVDVDAATDAARMLAALHERVERQFETYEAAEGSHPARRRAVATIATALATHVAVEDELLYPALRDHTGRHDAEIERQLAQDHLLDLAMVELGGMLPADRGYDGKVRVLMQVFRQHAHDAETLVGQALPRHLSPTERARLGRRMRERVGQLEGRPRPGW